MNTYNEKMKSLNGGIYMNNTGLKRTAILMLSVVLVFSMAVPVNADVAAVVPAYQYGLNSVVDDQAQAKQMLLTEWEAWKDKYVSKSGHRRVLFDGPDTVSEAMGYGMLMAVYFNEQTLFDEFFDYVEYCSDPNGLMHWKTNNGVVVGANSVTSAEEDIALALIFADKVWGSEGSIDYEAKAKDRLLRIRLYECNSMGQLLPGDTFSSPANPSYFAPGWYEIFSNYEGNDLWNRISYESYSVIKKAANPTTGLVPDWCSWTGSPAAYYSAEFGYDAVRVLWRMAVSYSWYGHSDAKAICSKPMNFFSNIGAANIVDGYELDGTPTGAFHSAPYVACAAAGTMTGTDRHLAKAFYDECLATGANNYYGSTLRLLVLMYMTGNFQNLYQNGKQIVSSAASAPSGTTPDAAAPDSTTQPEFTQGGLIDSAVVKGKTVLNISNMPIGAILEEMGGTYEWNAAEQKATIHWNGMTVELWNGQKSIKVNGVEKEVDIAPNVGTTSSVMMPSGFAANEPDRILSWEEGSIQIWNAVQKDMQNPSNKKIEQGLQKIRTTP